MPTEEQKPFESRYMLLIVLGATVVLVALALGVGAFMMLTAG